eukprot:COSAG01_NODE_4937_length_4611_cov_3.348260_1_plen_869_part_10
MVHAGAASTGVRLLLAALGTTAVVALGGADTGSPAMRAGRVDASHVWTGIMTDHNFSAPVLLLGIPTQAGSDSVVVRAEMVGSSGFRVRVTESSCEDDSHAAESIGYLLMESFSSSVGRLQASRTVVGSGAPTTTLTQLKTVGGAAVSFAHTISGSPVVLASVQSYNDPSFVHVRASSTTSQGFQIWMAEDEQANQVHTPETVGWLAISSTSTMSIGGLAWEARTVTGVDEEGRTVLGSGGWEMVSFASPFASVPVVFGTISSTIGMDPAALRMNGPTLSTTSVQIYVEEDDCDGEIAHAEERVAVLALTLEVDGCAGLPCANGDRCIDIPDNWPHGSGGHMCAPRACSPSPCAHGGTCRTAPPVPTAFYNCSTPVPAQSGACSQQYVALRSCAEVKYYYHDFPSGNYKVDPDGSGSMLEVFCDMSSGEGLMKLGTTESQGLFAGSRSASNGVSKCSNLVAADYFSQLAGTSMADDLFCTSNGRADCPSTSYPTLTRTLNYTNPATGVAYSVADMARLRTTVVGLSQSTRMVAMVCDEDDYSSTIGWEGGRNNGLEVYARDAQNNVLLLTGGKAGTANNERAFWQWTSASSSTTSNVRAVNSGGPGCLASGDATSGRNQYYTCPSGSYVDTLPVAFILPKDFVTIHATGGGVAVGWRTGEILVQTALDNNLNMTTSCYNCDVGWGGRYCDVYSSPCAAADCGTHATCVDTQSGYTCSCSSGYSGVSTHNSPTSCTDADGCAGVSCGANAGCTDLSAPAIGYRCSCTSGYNGTITTNQSTSCVDMDGCAGVSCGANAGCTDLSAPAIGYRCSCNSGYNGTITTNQSTSCVDMDGCAGVACGANAACADIPAPGVGYTCSCSSGYSGVSTH